MKKQLFRLYFLPAFFLLLIFSANSCKKSSTSTTTGVSIPVIVTNSTAINVTATTAQLGGVIDSFGNDIITEDGVCYSATNATPTISDGKATAGLVSGSILYPPITANMTSLVANTTYYARMYATNSAGTGYGSVIKFTTGTVASSITGVVTTFAGSGVAGYNDAAGLSAQFNNPQGVAVDSKGDVYVSDSFNNMIRMITPAGAVTTVAGSQTIGYQDGPAATAQFYAPRGLAFDSQGNLYVADFGNNVIRKITPDGTVSTYSGNGTAGDVDGSSAAGSEFNGPSGLSFDSSGNLYVADRGNSIIRKITPAGVTTTLAGTNNTTHVPGYLDATNLVAAFNKPNDLVVDASNNVDVADLVNSAIRKVTTPAGVTTTLAGGPSQSTLLNLPVGIAIDSKQNLYITDESGRILQYTAGNVIYILAGTQNVSGFVNGSGAAAQFSTPQGIAVDASGNIYVADQGNNCIRKVTITTTTVAN
jgi:sugar lactone lactonase YvrE